ncbi:MAG TPA: hypothetical protein VG052_05420 [Puia sp.]|jgi:hypothetical protein|nr:hypothetical protein [Puia sp.]
MKVSIMLAAIFTLCISNTMAQKETKQFSVGIGIEAGAPQGAFSDLYSLAAGFTVRFSYRAGPGFITLTGGAVGYDPKTVVVGQKKKVGLEIPVRAGYKYIVAHHFFIMGEAGYAEFKSYYGQEGVLASTTTGSFIAAPSVGVQFNAFEISLRDELNFRSGGGGVVGVRLGLNF